MRQQSSELLYRGHFVKPEYRPRPEGGFQGCAVISVALAPGHAEKYTSAEWPSFETEAEATEYALRQGMAWVDKYGWF